MIDKYAPKVIGDKNLFADQFKSEAKELGLSDTDAANILSFVPTKLSNSQAFLDKITGLWRYEYGMPSKLHKTKSELHGTHIWPPLATLIQGLNFAHARLPAIKLKAYLERLFLEGKHQDSLVEMFPLERLATNVPVDFEAAGLGQGNKTIDWVIGPIDNRLILMDVKCRFFDLYDAMDQENFTEPQHNCDLIFTSIENKFNSSDPDRLLQGVWIATQIAQEIGQLNAAFNKLDASKVHFCILGDHRADGFVLARRPEDEEFLRSVLSLGPSDRFTFKAA